MWHTSVREGGETILVAISEGFGQMVKDVMGCDGLREGMKKTGISAAYLGAMKSGHVPGSETLGQFIAGYQLDDIDAAKLVELSKQIRSDIDMESLIQAACKGEGLSASARLRVLECFREQRDREKTPQTSAA